MKQFVITDITGEKHYSERITGLEFDATPGIWSDTACFLIDLPVTLYLNDEDQTTLLSEHIVSIKVKEVDAPPLVETKDFQAGDRVEVVSFMKNMDGSVSPGEIGEIETAGENRIYLIFNKQFEINISTDSAAEFIKKI